MKKVLLASSAILTLSIFSQAALADNTQQLSKEELAAAQQDYVLEYNPQAQPRRSALFAHILDSLSQNSTMASADAMPTLSTESESSWSGSATL